MDFRTGVTSVDLPLVTVGILSYNYSMYIEDTLNSLLIQTYPHIELIIIDDCSKDNSVHIINDWINKQEVNCQLYVHEKNFGINRACNNVVRRSKGKYIALFASDDIMKPERIEHQVKEMEKAGSEYAFCYSDAELINEFGEYRGLYSNSRKIGGFHEGNIFYNFFILGFRIAAPTTLFRKAIFDDVGLYDERLSAEDYDMFIRILPLFKAKFCHYTGVKYRIKENKEMKELSLKRFGRFYHRDRVFIYLKLYKLIRRNNEWKNLQNAVTQKINFHLMQLSVSNLRVFYECFFYLLGNFYFKISFKRLALLQLKKIKAAII